MRTISLGVVARPSVPLMTRHGFHGVPAGHGALLLFDPSSYAPVQQERDPC